MVYRMMASTAYHLAKYSIQKPKNNLKKGALIFSIDVDVGDKILGVLNGGKNDANVHKYLSEYQIGEIEEFALPQLINAFDQHEVPATFAIRGQLEETNFSVTKIFGSKTNHEIASHSYSHKSFNMLSLEEAEKELTLNSLGMKKLGLKPLSFIYPRNRINFLNLLPKYGFKTYRSLGGRKLDTMFIEKNNNLYNIHPSLYLDNSVSVFLLKKILEVAIRKKAPLHIWFHLWNFGKNSEEIRKYLNGTFLPFLSYAQKKSNLGLLTLATMSSIINSL
jgi:peptidoglycan/xylan/chitin deacetylase (PgdA/CDA1 family)